MLKKYLSLLLRRALSVIAFGAILVATSEFWFYQVGKEVGTIGILLAYGLLGYLFLAVVQRLRVGTAQGLIIAVALLGFLIEGVPVPVVYANPPLSIVWTSLAWHALITLGLGWALFRHVMTKGSVVAAMVFNAGFGVFLGAWNAFMWNAREIEQTGEMVFDWQPMGPFVAQFLFGYALFLTGHALFERAFKPGMAFLRAEHLGLWGIAGVVSLLVAAGQGLLVLYPILAALVALCLIALQKDLRTLGVTWVDALHNQWITPWRYVLTLLIPVGAIAAYAAVVTAGIKLEMNAVVILTAGPVSVAAFVWALVVAFRRTT